jgi:putative proteasome-type protease
MLSSYSKMHIFDPCEDRVFVMLSAGNLSTTQAIVERIEQDLETPDALNSLRHATKLVEAARYVAQITREEMDHVQAATSSTGIDTSVSLIFGGQINGGTSSIYMIYSAGNFITDSDENPFLQIGESKYGKPILDRILTRNTSLEDAARCCIVSMDSTIKSNATVGPPIEVLIYENDSFTTSHYIKMEEDDPYLHSIKQAWNEAMNTAFLQLPQFQWEGLQPVNLQIVQEQIQD